MATLTPTYDRFPITPRKSNETDRRHLLSADTSVAPSESASMIGPHDADGYSIRTSRPASLLTATDGDGDRTPRATSPAPRRDTIAETPYRGFPSRAAYLAALEAWADEKRYMQYDTSLRGFYGATTLQEYAARPGVELNFGIKEKWRARKARKEGEGKGKGGAGVSGDGSGRRNTVS